MVSQIVYNIISETTRRECSTREIRTEILDSYFTMTFLTCNSSISDLPSIILDHYNSIS